MGYGGPDMVIGGPIAIQGPTAEMGRDHNAIMARGLVGPRGMYLSSHREAAIMLAVSVVSTSDA